MRIGKLGKNLGRPKVGGAGPYLIGAALLALLAGGAAVMYLRSAVPNSTVWVAAVDLEPGTVLEQSHLRAATQQVPKSALPEGAIENVDEVLGKRLRVALLAGDPVRVGHVVQTEKGSDLPGVLDLQTRAVVLPIDVVPQAERLSGGDVLELTAVLPYQTRDTNTQVATLVSRVEVLEILRDADDKAVGLMVIAESEDVAKLALALRSGVITAAVTPLDLPKDLERPDNLWLEELIGVEEEEEAQPSGPPVTQNPSGT